MEIKNRVGSGNIYNKCYVAAKLAMYFFEYCEARGAAEVRTWQRLG